MPYNANLTGQGWVVDPIPAPAAGASASSYLGQVATRCNFPSQILGSGTATWCGGVTVHWARDTIKDPKVVFPSWILSGANVETLLAGGTVKCSIAFSTGGARTGNTEGAVAFVNGFAVCTFPGLTIPNGSKFFVYYLLQNANGVPFRTNPAFTMLPEEGFTFGTGAATDYTVSGTPPAPYVFSQGYGPILILAQTVQPSILITGTSKAAGVADYAYDQGGDVGYARLYGARFGYTTIAMASTLLASYNAASKTYRNQILQGAITGIATGIPYHTHFHGYDLVNDLNGGGDTAASAVARLAAQAASVPNQVFIAPTNTPNTSSSDNFITAANQTVGASGKLVAANELIRQGVTGARLTIDLADMLDPFRTGKFIVSRNANDATTPQTASFTGVISGTTLTASSVTGTIIQGASLFGTGVGTGTQIRSQLTGTAGGAGTYQVSSDQTVASVAMTTGSVMTRDGLHENQAAYAQMATAAAPLLSLIQR